MGDRRMSCAGILRCRIDWLTCEDSRQFRYTMSLPRNGSSLSFQDLYKVQKGNVAMTASTMTEIPLVDLRAQYADLREEILTAVASVFDGMRLFLGPELQAFEQEFAQFCECREAIGISNGTDALE